jgi:recombinational DNA repair ATPase RecF
LGSRILSTIDTKENNPSKHKKLQEQSSIEIPSGRILFQGDIGCGKSTILSAIEFSLFGLGDSLRNKVDEFYHIYAAFRIGRGFVDSVHRYGYHHTRVHYDKLYSMT